MNRATSTSAVRKR